MKLPSNLEILTSDEELSLIRVARSSTMKNEVTSGKQNWAMTKLITHNLGLVHKICHRFPIKNASCSYEDLFQAGVEGLMYGIGKFDTKRGYRLSTYSYRWIQAYVARYYQNHGKTIRIPVHLATVEMKVNKATEQLTKELGRTPTKGEIASIVDDSDKVDEILQAGCTSLNVMMNDADDFEALAGVDNTETHDYEMECDILLSRVADDVSPRDLNMFVHRYGLCGKKEHSLNEIAEFHQVTRSRVHQVTNQVFNRMREVATMN